MLVGIYIGQFCITTLTYFFITWFPVYLVQARHMSVLKGGFAVALPALCGSIGGVLGGICSDALLRRGHSLTFARKAPIIAGMLLSVTMIACNYTNVQAVVMFLMSLAFFGKGFGALGWTVIADTSPKELIGLNGGLFNLFGNTAGITTPIIIGFIVQKTGSFNGALVFVARHSADGHLQLRRHRRRDQAREPDARRTRRQVRMTEITGLSARHLDASHPRRGPRLDASEPQRRARALLHPQPRHPHRQRRPHRRRRSPRRREDSHHPRRIEGRSS